MMIGSRVLVAGVLAGLAADAVADPLYFRYCNGVVLRMAPAADENGYDLAVEQAGAWSGIGHIRFDPEGRTVTRRIGEGNETRFAPHNCEKVAGICEYTETAPDGTETRKLRINGREPDGSWSYSILEDKAGEMELAVVGTVSYADDGLTQEDNRTAVEGYKKSCAIRIEAPIAAE